MESELQLSRSKMSMFISLIVSGACVSMHFGKVQLIQTKEVSVVKVKLGLESQPAPKWPFLTAISKISCPSKIEKLGIWQASILFKKIWRFYFVFLPGCCKITPYVTEMASKLIYSYLSRCFHTFPCHLAAGSYSFSEVSLV